MVSAMDLLGNPVIQLILVIIVGATIVATGLVNAYSAAIGSSLLVIAGALSLAAIMWLFGGGGITGKRN